MGWLLLNEPPYLTGPIAGAHVVAIDLNNAAKWVVYCLLVYQRSGV
jgi:hypothetical protein